MGFVGIDDFFDGPVIGAITARRAALHAPLFLQAVELLALGEQLAALTVQRCTDALGAGHAGALDQAFKGRTGVLCQWRLEVQRGPAMLESVGVLFWPGTWVR